MARALGDNKLSGRSNGSHSLSSSWPGVNSQLRRRVSRDFSLADRMHTIGEEMGTTKTSSSLRRYDEYKAIQVLLPVPSNDQNWVLDKKPKWGEHYGIVG